MDILSRGGFQAAVLSDAGSHSIPSPGAKTWSDSPASSYNYVVSRSNSRASSRAQSPGSGANLESPQMHVNVIDSPLGSPQVSPQHLHKCMSLRAHKRFGESARARDRRYGTEYVGERELFSRPTGEKARDIRYAAETTISPLSEFTSAQRRRNRRVKFIRDAHTSRYQGDLSSD